MTFHCDAFEGEGIMMARAPLRRSLKNTGACWRGRREDDESSR